MLPASCTSNGALKTILKCDDMMIHDISVIEAATIVVLHFVYVYCLAASELLVGLHSSLPKN